ncbi:MAG: DUF3108 domain-containing protein [Rhodobacteraceae bacterium]|nr:DUF3108 domain-containing protein [Paracoccaceae bacterium]
MTICLGLATTGARAGNDAFHLKISGLRVGAVYLTSHANTDSYAVSGVIQSTGLVAAVRQFSFRGSAAGRVQGARLQPEHYQETADTGRRSSDALIEYSAGVPRVIHYNSTKEAGPDTPDPATQGGTLDPLSAIWALLRDVPRGSACALDVAIFDGRRRSRIWMVPAGKADGLPVCKGRYERLRGFTAREVSRHRKFDFRLSYSDAGGGMLRVERVAFDSSYGTAAIVRR